MTNRESGDPSALSEIDFPPPREDCVKSVQEVQQWLHKNGPATKAEILQGISPEKNHQIGLPAAQALGKLNDIEGYREWWWNNVAKPGLEAFPDIKSSADGETEWRSVSDPELEAHKTSQVAPRTDLDEFHSILANPAAPPPEQAKAARKLFTEMAQGREVDSHFVEPVARLLARPSLDADSILLRCLSQLAQQHPENVLESSSEITEFVSMNDSQVTAAATECIANLAIDHPEEFVDFTPHLDALLDTENKEIRSNALFIIARIGREHPDEAKPLTPTLISCIESSSGTDQNNALSALGNITSAYPSAAIPAIEELLTLTDADDPQTRGNAIGVLADIAKTHADEVIPYSSHFTDQLHDEDEYVRGNAVSAILHLGVADRESVLESIPALIELLDDPSPVVRRNTCKALGNLNVVVAIEQLRSRAESDTDERVRFLADWAIDEID